MAKTISLASKLNLRSSRGASIDREAELNRLASEAFSAEYGRETGTRLRFKRVGDPNTFPDAFLETEQAVELSVEFVSVVFSFIWQEEAYFNKYRERFYMALRPDRPRYQNVAIRLQVSSEVVEGTRPHRFPDVDGSEGKKLVVEFRDLLARHLDKLRSSHGHLIEDIAPDASRAFKTLLKHFNAIIIWDISEDDPRKPHAEDPLLESPIAIHLTSERIEAVRRALTTKAEKVRKDPKYEANFLVLHTLETPGKPYFPGAAMDANEIEELGRQLLTKERGLCERFDEIWFLNAYWTEGRRLYRLKDLTSGIARPSRVPRRTGTSGDEKRVKRIQKWIRRTLARNPWGRIAAVLY